MEKLTAAQILEIVAENMSEYDFSENEWGVIPLSEEEIKLCTEAEEARESFKKSIEGVLSLPPSKREIHPDYLRLKAMPSYWDKKEELGLKKLGLGKIVEVDSYGGEGQGETWYSVKHFVDHDVYIRIDGVYSSYEGVEFHDGYGKEVFPQQRTITVYE